MSESGTGAGIGELDALSFEAALERLEATVSRLEQGEMPLEQALELFEQGIALSRRCSATLDAAEKRIEILLAEREGDGDEWASEPFDEALDDGIDDDDDDADAF